MKRWITLPFALGLPLAVAVSAAAVIIDSGNGMGNVTAPAPDPGWGNVGSSIATGLTVVYLGDGWVLSANHVGPGNVTFGGVPYTYLSGASVRLSNPDLSLADLVLFKIADPYPPLPALTIRTTPPPIHAPPFTDSAVVMIGNGRNRGAATNWSGFDGWFWGVGSSKRWGTNFVENVNADLYESAFGTQLFGSQFDEVGPGHSTHEAQAAVGDSGGAVFHWDGSNPSTIRLAGIMIGILSYGEQPDETALYTNTTLSADLSVYRDEIEYWMPEPAGGLWAGAALVAVLARARRRISAPSSPGSTRTSDRAR